MGKKKTNDNNYKISDEDKNTLFEKTDTFLGRFANYIVMFFIFLSIALVFLDTIPGFTIKYLIWIFIVDYSISIVFLFEYIYRWKHSDNKAKFPFRFLNILDFLAFAPILIVVAFSGVGRYGTLYFFRIFRIFRVFKIFELLKKMPIAIRLVKGIGQHKIEYGVAIFVIFIILTTFSSIIYLVEFNFGNSETFSSLPTTLWWGIVTMTTVGYGDIVPITTVGKIVASMLMFLGPILITVLSSITVVIFLESAKIVNISGRSVTCSQCNTYNESDAKFCKNCGINLKSP